MTARADVTYLDLFRHSAGHAPWRAALVISGQRLTYAALSAAAERRVAELVALSVGPGDRFGLLMPNCPALVAALRFWG